MIGLVLVTHGRLGQEFLAALEHIDGPQEAVAVISIFAEDDTEKRRGEILAAVKKVERGAGVIILTDLFGGTPSNLSISVMEETKAEVIAGVNLPLLLKLAQIRDGETLQKAVATAAEAGQKYIKVASTVLGVR